MKYDLHFFINITRSIRDSANTFTMKHIKEEGRKKFCNVAIKRLALLLIILEDTGSNLNSETGCLGSVFYTFTRLL